MIKENWLYLQMYFSFILWSLSMFWRLKQLSTSFVLKVYYWNCGQESLMAALWNIMWYVGSNWAQSCAVKHLIPCSTSQDLDLICHNLSTGIFQLSTLEKYSYSLHSFSWKKRNLYTMCSWRDLRQLRHIEWCLIIPNYLKILSKRI